MQLVDYETYLDKHEGLAHPEALNAAREPQLAHIDPPVPCYHCGQLAVVALLFHFEYVPHCRACAETFLDVYDHPTPKIYTVKEVAAILRIHPNVISKKLKAGAISGHKAQGVWRISQAEVNRLLHLRFELQREEYCPLETAAELLHVPYETLLSWVRDGLAEPLQQRGRFAERRPVWHLVEHGPERALLIALNSNRAARLPLRFACGEIGMSQRIALEKLLADPRIVEVTVIVLFHHHLIDQADPFNTLLDAQALLNILAGRVQMVLFGHRHQAQAWVNYAGMPYVLACDNSPGKPFAREITLDRQTISIIYRPISNAPFPLPRT